jgi:hypothetical protein
MQIGAGAEVIGRMICGQNDKKVFSNGFPGLYVVGMFDVNN